MSLLDKVPGDLNLYIGGAFTLRRKQTLHDANITHVVSALRDFSPDEPSLYKPAKHLIIQVDDVEDENLLEHFSRSNDFIQDGLDGGGAVFVHCAMGKSRSATLVLAYLLSTNQTLTPASALSLLRTSRPLVEPNTGFMSQLELYHQMKCPRNVEEQPPYQRWLYQRDVEIARACGQAPHVDKIRFEDEHVRALEGVRQEIETEANTEVEFKCRKCRRSLATAPFILPHAPPEPPYSPPSSPDPSSFGKPCAHIFLEPLSWMRDELTQGKMEGRLDCPNPRCKSVIGKYSWHGHRCSCGGWVTPGISLARGKVDEARVGRGKGSGEGFGVRMGPGVGGGGGGGGGRNGNL
ncbi:dual specificity protein phosphatase 12 [Aulographum hederae CBS 113979]|uniref:protein-tyrosine-phosphatase n=1 Tax=Aulographum hederae CBS 113979 TaxID=1176131 RepID=A0A6G1GPW8_9PEZI|nr:dual specificity protein phosphatase 12 [Aulographum hederae CBS 113979]